GGRAARAPGGGVTSPADTSRRSRMPVRWTIHSSDVSTICSRSWLVSRRSGTKLPRPAIPTRMVPAMRQLPRGLGRRLRESARGLLDVQVDLRRHRLARRADRVAERGCLRSAVADGHDALDAEQQGTAVLGVVDLRRHAREHLVDLLLLDAGLLHQPEHRSQHALAARLADLQQHVAGEAVPDHDLARAREQLDALHVAVELDRHLLEQPARLLDQRVALQLLAADVEDAYLRLRDAERAAVVGRAHDRVLREVMGLRLRVGADVDDQERVLLALDDGADRGAPDAFEAA